MVRAFFDNYAKSCYVSVEDGGVRPAGGPSTCDRLFTRYVTLFYTVRHAPLHGTACSFTRAVRDLLHSTSWMVRVVRVSYTTGISFHSLSHNGFYFLNGGELYRQQFSLLQLEYIILPDWRGALAVTAFNASTLILETLTT